MKWKTIKKNLITETVKLDLSTDRVSVANFFSPYSPWNHNLTSPFTYYLFIDYSTVTMLHFNTVHVNYAE